MDCDDTPNLRSFWPIHQDDSRTDRYWNRYNVKYYQKYAKNPSFGRDRFHFMRKNVTKLKFSSTHHIKNTNFRHLVHRLKVRSSPCLSSVELELDEKNTSIHFPYKLIAVLLRLRPKKFRFVMYNKLLNDSERNNFFPFMLKLLVKTSTIVNLAFIFKGQPFIFDLKDQILLKSVQKMARLKNITLNLSEAISVNPGSEQSTIYFPIIEYSKMLEIPSIKTFSFTLNGFENNDLALFLQRYIEQKDLVHVDLEIIFKKEQKGILNKFLNNLTGNTNIRQLSLRFIFQIYESQDIFLYMWDLISFNPKLTHVCLQFKIINLSEREYHNFYREIFPKRKLSYSLSPLVLPQGLKELEIDLSSFVLLTEENFQSFAKTIGSHINLETLKLNFDKAVAMATNSFSTLSEMFISLAKLKSLDLNMEGARMKMNKKKKFISNLAYLKNLRSLNLNMSYSSIKDSHLFLIESSIKGLTKLNSLSLVFNECKRLKCKDVALFFRSCLQMLTTLEKLNFEWTSSDLSSMPPDCSIMITKSLQRLMNSKIYLINLNFGKLHKFSVVTEDYKSRDLNRPFETI